jgi:hypothetical protein
MRNALALWIAAGALAVTAGAADWVDLFNGKDLQGWVQKGGAAKYRAENGELIGTTVPNTGNSFLCTTRNYTNFILELEFLVDPQLNSCVQIRSSLSETPTVEEWYGKEVKFPAGRVHGLQIEIDPAPRAWTGGVYGEGGIGWQVNLEKNEPARQAFKQKEWNKFRIEAQGESIKTWLNGVPAAEHKADKVRSGFIALQVHGVGKRVEPLEVRFRRIRLQELP